MAPDPRELRRLIDRSRVLDPALKHAWLRVLPLMDPAHRRELAEILRLEVEAASDSVLPAARAHDSARAEAELLAGAASPGQRRRSRPAGRAGQATAPTASSSRA